MTTHEASVQRRICVSRGPIRTIGTASAIQMATYSLRTVHFDADGVVLGWSPSLDARITAEMVDVARAEGFLVDLNVEHDRLKAAVGA